MKTTYTVNIYNGERIISQLQTQARKGKGGAIFDVLHDGQWKPAKIDSWGVLAIDISQKASKPAQVKRIAASETASETAIDYETWKAGKLGGGKVRAPKGMGEEWAARLYCEQAIERAKRYAYNDYSTRQLRTGSRTDRRRQTVKSAHRQAWEYGIEIAEKAINAIDGYWTGKAEIVKEAFAYSSYMIEMAGN